jgi:hypothetical protein
MSRARHKLTGIRHHIKDATVGAWNIKAVEVGVPTGNLYWRRYENDAEGNGSSYESDVTAATKRYDDIFQVGFQCINNINGAGGQPGSPQQGGNRAGIVWEINQNLSDQNKPSIQTNAIILNATATFTVNQRFGTPTSVENDPDNSSGGEAYGGTNYSEIDFNGFTLRLVRNRKGTTGSSMEDKEHTSPISDVECMDWFFCGNPHNSGNTWHGPPFGPRDQTNDIETTVGATLSVPDAGVIETANVPGGPQDAVVGWKQYDKFVMDVTEFVQDAVTNRAGVASGIMYFEEEFVFGALTGADPWDSGKRELLRIYSNDANDNDDNYGDLRPTLHITYVDRGTP